MSQNLNVIAIIPARGGSKSIPKKNIKLLNGKPLIEYTINAAIKSKLITSIVVSTDDDEIFEVCSKFKQLVIIRRPEYLASDTSSTEDCLMHAIEEFKIKFDDTPDIILTLEPTSPLRTSNTIDKCIKIFLETDSDSVISLVESRECFGKIINNKFKHLAPNQARRRQDRDPLYKECGTIYGTRLSTLMDKKSVFGDIIHPLIVPQRESYDINYDDDFNLIEALVKYNI